MTPENLNRLAMRGTIGILVVEVLVVRSDQTHRDNPGWRSQIEALVRRIEHA